jgi:hypothetical protein
MLYVSISFISMAVRLLDSKMRGRNSYGNPRQDPVWSRSRLHRTATIGLPQTLVQFQVSVGMIQAEQEARIRGNRSTSWLVEAAGIEPD